jgi:hypothetical protein
MTKNKRKTDSSLTDRLPSEMIYTIYNFTKEKKYLIYGNQRKEIAFNVTYLLESKTKW